MCFSCVTEHFTTSFSEPKEKLFWQTLHAYLQWLDVPEGDDGLVRATRTLRADCDSLIFGVVGKGGLDVGVPLVAAEEAQAVGEDLVGNDEV